MEAHLCPFQCLLPADGRDWVITVRFHPAPRGRKGRLSKPHQTAVSGSCPDRTAPISGGVLDCIQPETFQPERSAIASPRGSRSSDRALSIMTANVLIVFLKCYKRFISPLLPSACRFHPTCSVYMMEAIERHGSVRGIGMGLKRLGKCHPFHSGGFDPVP